MKKILAVLALVCGAVSAQAVETDLIGTYAIKEKGAMKEFLKVSQDNGKFVVAEKRLCCINLHVIDSQREFLLGF